MWCHNQQSLPSPSLLQTLPYHFLTLEKTKLNDIVLSCVRFLFSFYQTNTCQNWRSQDIDHDDVYCGIAKAILFFVFVFFLIAHGLEVVSVSVLFLTWIIWIFLIDVPSLNAGLNVTTFVKQMTILRRKINKMCFQNGHHLKQL